MYKRATRNNWPVKPKMRNKIIKRFNQILDDDCKKPVAVRDWINVGKVVLLADKYNLELAQHDQPHDNTITVEFKDINPTETIPLPTDDSESE